MKKLIPLLPIAFMIIGCATTGEKPDATTGVFKMLTQSFRSEAMDTSITTGQQLKIFNGYHMMYARFNPTDSVSSFGVGTYSTNPGGDTITENIFFTASDTLRNETPREYRLLIERTVIGYNQIIPRIEDAATGQIYRLTEEYESVGTEEVSPLAGIWKLTSHRAIIGTDTTNSSFTQYKLYYGGHFIWGRSYTDSAGKNQTAIGHGKFVTDGAGKIIETVNNSTLSAIREHDFEIAYELRGRDAYRQTFKDSEGVTIIEDYERVKKKEG